MKKALALLLALVMLLSLAACGAKEEAPAETQAAAAPEAPAEEAAPAEAEEGKVFRIYAWNEEFKGFFEKYYEVPEGITVEWVINPNEGGVYQDKLDEALAAV